MNTPLLGSMHLSLPVLLLLAKATIILLVAFGVTLTMQRASAGSRHLVWLVALATLLLVPVLGAWGPVKVTVLPPTELSRTTTGTVLPRDVQVPAGGQSAVLTATPDAQADVPPASSLRPLAPEDKPATSSIAAAVTNLSPLTLVLTLWGAVTLAILASLAWSGLAVRRIVRHASPLEDASWRTPLYEVADRMGLNDAPRLLMSDTARMPFACGIVTPTIVLPADCDAWTQERRRAVLLHELAHVRRHDLLGHTLGRVTCALYWFHPLAWTAARHLRNESERACDDLALSCGTRATDYAEHLLEIVTSVRRDVTPTVALAMARRKEFEGRMLAILDPELRHSQPTRRQSAALIGTLALVALSVSAVSPVARPAEAAQLPAAPAPVHADSPHFDMNSRLTGPMRTTFRSDTAFHERTVQRTSTTQSTSTSEFTSPAERVGQVVGQAVGTAAGATVDAVVQALREQGVNVEHTAPGAQSRDDRAQLLARVLATDTSASLRRVAAWGLAEYGNEQVATDALAQALRKDASPVVREMAAWALAESGGRHAGAIDALGAALKGDADEKVRATAAWAMGEVGDRDAVGALTAALSSGSPAVRTRALWAIGSLEPREAPREVVALLRDPDAKVRRLSAWALYNIEDASAAGPLKDAIATEQDKDVQLAEIRALGALGEKSVDAIKSLVDSPDPRVRSMAVHALAGGNASGPWPWPWPQPRPYP